MSRFDLISVICPTISGREHWLHQCKLAYLERSVARVEFLLVTDAPTCGAAWNIGLAAANGDYLHLTADDLEPLPDWDTVAVEWADRGVLPTPRITNPDGTLQSCGDTAAEVETGTPTVLARVPFFRRDMLSAIYPIIETHYMTDAWVAHKAALAGWPTLVVREYRFVHHFAPEGRLDGPQGRLGQDIAAYQQAIQQ